MANTNGPNSSLRKGTQRHEAPKDYIAVARGSDLIVVRVVGAGNMITAPGLADFADEQRKHGFKRFVFDLEKCTRMDSTFMGVMVGMHSRESSRHRAQSSSEMEALEAVPVSPEEALAAMRRPRVEGDAAVVNPNDQPECQLSAVNVSSDLRNLMSMLGVDKFVKIKGECDLTKLETTILPEKMLPTKDRRKLILKAHETLVEIDKRNEAQFGAFLKTLSAELARE
jgi:hypothetical protein